MKTDTKTVTLPKREFDVMELTITEQTKLIEKLKSKHMVIIKETYHQGYGFYFPTTTHPHTIEEITKLLNKDLLDAVERLTKKSEQGKLQLEALREINKIRGGDTSTEEPAREPWYVRFFK